MAMTARMSLRAVALWVSLLFVGLGHAQELAFTAPDLSTSSANTFSVGKSVTVSWTTPYQDTTLILYQHDPEGKWEYEILALNYAPDATSYTWSADTVNAINLADGGPLYFSLQNGNNIECDGCVVKSPFFNLERSGSSSGGSSSSSPQSASSAAAASSSAASSAAPSTFASTPVVAPSTRASASGTVSAPTSTAASSTNNRGQNTDENSAATSSATAAGGQQTGNGGSSGNGSPTAAAASNDGNDGHTTSDKSHSHLAVGLGVGLGVGLALLLILGILLCLFLRRRKKKREQFNYRPTTSGNWTQEQWAHEGSTRVPSRQMEEVDSADSPEKRESGALGAWANAPPPESSQSRQSEAGYSQHSNPFRPSYAASRMSHQSWIEPFEFERPETRKSDAMSQLRTSLSPNDAREADESAAGGALGAAGAAGAAGAVGAMLSPNNAKEADEEPTGDDSSSRYDRSGVPSEHGTPRVYPADAQQHRAMEERDNQYSDMSFAAGTDLSSLEGLPERRHSIPQQALLNDPDIQKHLETSQQPAQQQQNDGRNWPLP